MSCIKRGARYPTPNEDGKPKPGTMLRAVYDAMRTGRVIKVRREFGSEAHRLVSQLRDFYGMDIQGTRAGSFLVGEWHGPYYEPIESILAGAASETDM